MRSLVLLRRLTQRQRRALAAAVAIAVLAVVVIANQPPADESHPQARAAVAHPVSRVDPPLPTGTPIPVLDVLHAHVAFTDETADHPHGPALKVDAGILVDIDTGAILWARNPHLAHAPASTTKILSTLVALENFSPDRVVDITADALHQAGDETKMGLVAGQQLTVQELLDGMMMVSANDAATALAVDTVGIEPFVSAMNRQEEALGLHDSHFTTPVGLDDPDQLASAYDLAAIASVDVTRFPLFRQIVSQTEIDLPASPSHGAFYLGNLNRLLRLYPGADGIKPGWTGNAGGCLVGMAERDGHRLISVVLGADSWYTDSRDLLDWGFVQEGLPSLLATPTPKHG